MLDIPLPAQNPLDQTLCKGVKLFITTLCLGHFDHIIQHGPLTADGVRLVGHRPVGMHTIGLPVYEFEIRIAVLGQGGFLPEA